MSHTSDTIFVVTRMEYGILPSAIPANPDERKYRMADLTLQFTKAKSRVEATKEDKANAAKAHQDVRSCLEADGKLQSYGIDTVLIGSYKRRVAIRRVKDVDVLSKLPQLPRDVGPRDLLRYFETVLRDTYGYDRVEAQSRSVKVDFPGFGLAVDAVPARPSMQGAYLEIPDRTEGWEQTNPERFTSLTTAMNDSYDGEYVPLVKLIRQTRRHNLGKRPGGFYFEILTYHAAEAGLDRNSTAALFTSTLRSISDWLTAINAGVPVPDPDHAWCTHCYSCHRSADESGSFEIRRSGAQGRRRPERRFMPGRQRIPPNTRPERLP